ncbi:MAG: serine/threonine-protein kinase [Elusimicrobiota bacterium]
MTPPSRAVLLALAALLLAAPAGAQDQKRSEKDAAVVLKRVGEIRKNIAARAPEVKKRVGELQGKIGEYSPENEQDMYAQRIAEIKREVAKDMRELPPVLERLIALKGKYAATPDLETLAAEREPLRRTLREGRERIKANAEEFHHIRKDYQFQQGVIMFSKLVTGEGEAPVKNYETLLDLGDFDKDGALDFGKRIQNELRLDDEARAAVIRSRARAQKHKRYVAAGTAALGLLLAVLYLLSRRKKTKLPVPAAAAGAAPPPAGAAPPPAKAPPREADVVGTLLDERFQVEALLRSGTLGPVYAATDRTDGCKVVLKSVVEDFHRTRNELERFFARLRTLAEFKHRNLAVVRSVFRVDSRIYIAAEHVGGVPLTKFIAPGNFTELRSVKLIVSQIAILLDAAHEKRLIHGDISPSNVIVQEDGTVKMLDLGLGLEARRRAAQLSLSRAIGDPAYLAPEQELGTEFKQSDLYSLGALCYAMLTGRPPFAGPNHTAQKRERRYPPASGFSDDIPVEVDPVIHKALEPEPPHRYQKGMDLFSALDSVPERIN